jgi:hypothetical protein
MQSPALLIHTSPTRLLRDRRSFIKLAGAGAIAALAAGKIEQAPRAVFASGTAEALLLNCIDFRLIHYVNDYMDKRGLTGEYDQVILAGASLGAQNDTTPEWTKTWWDHVGLSLQLHSISRIIVIDHRDCGAYKLAFNADLAQDPQAETEIHTAELTALRANIEDRYPTLEVELFLMALDGTVQPIGLKAPAA